MSKTSQHDFGTCGCRDTRCTQESARSTVVTCSSHTSTSVHSKGDNPFHTINNGSKIIQHQTCSPMCEDECVSEEERVCYREFVELLWSSRGMEDGSEYIKSIIDTLHHSKTLLMFGAASRVH